VTGPLQERDHHGAEIAAVARNENTHWPPANWMTGTGPHDQIVGSRVTGAVGSVDSGPTLYVAPCQATLAPGHAQDTISREHGATLRRAV
jgi:hypothetical protein